MAYINQEEKAQIAAKVKLVLSKFKVKASLSINHHSTLVLNVKSGPLDFIKNHNEAIANYNQLVGYQRTPANVVDYFDVNTYHTDTTYTGKVRDFFKEVLVAMNDLNYDNSDIQSDYFDVGYYVRINIGKYEKPYELV